MTGPSGSNTMMDLTPPSMGQGRLSEAVNRARRLRLAGRHRDALALVDRVIQERAFPRAILERGRTLVGIGQLEAARHAFESALCADGVKPAGKTARYATCMLRILAVSLGEEESLEPKDEKRTLWTLRSMEAGDRSEPAYGRLLAAATQAFPLSTAVSKRYWRLAAHLIEENSFSTIIVMMDAHAGTKESSLLHALLSVYWGDDREVLFSAGDDSRICEFLAGMHGSARARPEFCVDLLSRATAQFPDSVELLKASIRVFGGRKDHDRVIDATRRLAQLGASDAVDLHRRVQALNRLGRTAVVARYADYLRFAATKRPELFETIAERQWAAHRPSDALATLAAVGPERWGETPSAVRTAVRCLATLRRYGEANRLLEQHAWCAESVPKHLRTTVGNAARYLSGFACVVEPSQDAAVQAVDRWLTLADSAEIPRYEPVPRRVMLSAFSLGLGGSERQVATLATTLATDPDIESISVVYRERRESTYAIDARSERVVTVGLDSMDRDLDVPFFRHPLITEVARYARYFGLSNIIPLARAIQALQPDILHVRGGLYAEAVLAAILSGTPRVVLQFGSMTRGFQSTGSELYDLRQRLVEHCCQRAAEYPNFVLAANSRVAASDWASNLRLEDSRVDVIYNGLDEHQLGFSQQIVGVEHRSIGSEAVVGGVLRFESVKDPLLWVSVAGRVLEQVPSARFILVGDGPLAPALQRRISNLGLSTHFEMPGIVQHDLASYYRRMSVFLLASRTESLPNVVIEAQLAGVPVVAPRVGGIAEAIASPATGILTERRCEDLAQGVVTALRNREWRQEVQRTAPAIIRRRFSTDRMLADTRVAYGLGDSGIAP